MHRLHVPRILAAVITVERHADGVRRSATPPIGVARAAFRWRAPRRGSPPPPLCAPRRPASGPPSDVPGERLVPQARSFPPDVASRPRAESHARALDVPRHLRAERLETREGRRARRRVFVRPRHALRAPPPDGWPGPAVNLVLAHARTSAARRPRPLVVPLHLRLRPRVRLARLPNLRGDERARSASASREPPRGRAPRVRRACGGGGFHLVRLRRFKRVRGGTRRRALGPRVPPPRLSENPGLFSLRLARTAPPRVAPSPPSPPPSSPSRSPSRARPPHPRNLREPDRSDAGTLEQSPPPQGRSRAGPRVRPAGLSSAATEAEARPERAAGSSARGPSQRARASASCGEEARRRRRRGRILLRRRRRGRVEEGGAERRRVVRGGVLEPRDERRGGETPVPRREPPPPPRRRAPRTNPSSVVPGTSRRRHRPAGSAGRGGVVGETIARRSPAAWRSRAGQGREQRAEPESRGTLGPGRGCETGGANSPRLRRDAPHRATQVVLDVVRTETEPGSGRSRRTRERLGRLGTFAAGRHPPPRGRAPSRGRHLGTARRLALATETAGAPAGRRLPIRGAFSALSSAAACASRTRTALSSAETGADVPSAGEPPEYPSLYRAYPRPRPPTKRPAAEAEAEAKAAAEPSRGDEAEPPIAPRGRSRRPEGSAPPRRDPRRPRPGDGVLARSPPRASSPPPPSPPVALVSPALPPRFPSPVGSSSTTPPPSSRRVGRHRDRDRVELRRPDAGASSSSAGGAARTASRAEETRVGIRDEFLVGPGEGTRAAAEGGGGFGNPGVGFVPAPRSNSPEIRSALPNAAAEWRSGRRRGGRGRVAGGFDPTTGTIRRMVALFPWSSSGAVSGSREGGLRSASGLPAIPRSRPRARPLGGARAEVVLEAEAARARRPRARRSSPRSGLFPRAGPWSRRGRARRYASRSVESGQAPSRSSRRRRASASTPGKPPAERRGGAREHRPSTRTGGWNVGRRDEDEGRRAVRRRARRRVAARGAAGGGGRGCAADLRGGRVRGAGMRGACARAARRGGDVEGGGSTTRPPNETN